MRLAALLVVAFVSTGAAGCTKHIRAPKTAQPVASIDGAAAVAAWERLLQKHVNEVGQIDFEAIEKDRDDLDLYVGWAAKNGPKSTPEAFPTREAKLAYWLNTYNALCLYNVIENVRRPKQIVRFFLWTKLDIDGRKMSLYALENSIIRPEFKEPRVHFILNCMVKGCPRLPREPIRPETLEAQLEAATRLFFSEEPRNVRVDHAKKIVRLSSILKFYTEDFLEPYTSAKSLIEYANLYRESKLPADYELKFIEYDWSLNQTPRGSASR